MALRINIVTLFPELFDEPLASSIVGRAAAIGLVRYRVVNLRDHAHDRHKTVDDYAYGGGAGMVLKPEPFFEALEALDPPAPVVLLSARGKLFRHSDAVRYSVADEMTVLCGHYKDVDQRVAEWPGTEEISVGDFVLSGGTDSLYEGLLSPPTYTRPPLCRGLAVPEVLLSGDHAKIAAWRRSQAEELTRTRRPDLWDRYRAEHRSAGPTFED